MPENVKGGLDAALNPAQAEKIGQHEANISYLEVLLYRILHLLNRPKSSFCFDLSNILHQSVIINQRVFLPILCLLSLLLP